MIDGDQDEPTLREQYTRERQELERDIAERDARIKRDETLEWVKRRAEGGPEPRVDFSGPLDARPSTRTAAPASLTAEWQRYIEQRIKQGIEKRELAFIGALGDTLCKEIVATERTCTALRKDVDRLTVELAELKSEMKTRAALAEVTGRLERLEAMPAARSSSIKAVG